VKDRIYKTIILPVTDEIKKHVLAANKCLHCLRKHLKSRLISRKTRIMMYKVLVRLVLSCASETWPLSKLDERLLSIFERRILRYIFGPVEENGTWRRGYNHKLYKLFNESDITGYIKVKRHEWAGHLIRTIENRTIKKIFNTKPEGTRKVGRPKLRWEECVCQDNRILGVKNWRSVALNREEWRLILRKGRAHKGLSCQ
jgi:hypothetical protein